MPARPRLTVGIAVYNGSNYIASALRSLVDQDYEDVEILVADNASTDDTVAICETFAEDDPRIRILRSDENRGIGWNHDRLVFEAQGEYFKWASHDDLYQPSFLSACVKVLDEDPEVALCYTGTIDIDGDDKFLLAWPVTNRASSVDPVDRFRDVMLNERHCFPFFGVVRTDVLKSTVLNGDYSGSDHPLLADLALRGRWVEIPEALFEHREHPDRSMAAYSNPRDRIVLFRPKSKGKLAFPRWRMARGYVEVVARSPLPLRDKLRTAPAFASWTAMWWKTLLLEPLGTIRAALR